LKSTASSTFVELRKQYRSTVEFNFIDSTALINLINPCKRAFTEKFYDGQSWTPRWHSATNRKVAGSIPRSKLASVEFFIDIKSFRSHYEPGVDSSANGN
jgi:hypothetical protein